MSDERGYDVFISYAREDAAWVRDNLHARLVQCRTRDGRRPRVFLDTSPEGIAAGVNYITAIESALQTSERIVPIYTPTYFRKPMCEWELTAAFHLDPNGRLGKIVPVLADPEAASLVPLRMSNRNYLDARTEDWFGRFCATLGLVPDQAPPRLEFRQQPQLARVNQTLPPVKVAIVAAEGWLRDEEVTLASDRGGLQGTLTVKSADGIATFDDLLLTSTTSPTRLIALAEGTIPAYSEPITVAPDDVSRAVVQEVRDSHVVLPCHGEAVFFDDEQLIGVVERGSVRIFDRLGQVRAAADFRSRPRLVRRSASGIVIVEWSGIVHVCSSDGRICSSGGGVTGEEVEVIGDARAEGESVLVGYWDGRVIAFSPGEKPVELLRHEGGVQGLARARGFVFVCDLEGALCVYEGERLVQSFPIDPIIRLVRPFPKCLVVVGETRLYNLPFDRKTVLGQALSIGNVTAALGDATRPILVDAYGKGVSIDEHLAVWTTFHAAAGAIPMSADRDGRHCVFHNRNGSRSLMVDGRLTYSYSRGVLAVSPSGQHFAVGDGASIHLLSAAEFGSMSGAGGNVAAAS